jgi:hypothetical protein
MSRLLNTGWYGSQKTHFPQITLIYVETLLIVGLPERKRRKAPVK